MIQDWVRFRNDTGLGSLGFNCTPETLALTGLLNLTGVGRRRGGGGWQATFAPWRDCQLRNWLWVTRCPLHWYVNAWWRGITPCHSAPLEGESPLFLPQWMVFPPLFPSASPWATSWHFPRGGVVLPLGSGMLPRQPCSHWQTSALFSQRIPSLGNSSPGTKTCKYLTR